MGHSEPSVILLSHSIVTENLLEILPYPVGEDGRDIYQDDADLLAEFAGRSCYNSFDRPRPSTAYTADYLENIINQGHESVLAHASATFYITGVSRSLAQEMIRSRFLAFSELSQRYVDASELQPVYPPDADDRQRMLIDDSFDFDILRYNGAVEQYTAMGYNRKDARSAARAHLPLCTETRLVVSGNMRAWRDFLRQRLSPHADAEIRRLAVAILNKLFILAPWTIRDIPEEMGYDSRFDGVHVVWQRQRS